MTKPPKSAKAKAKESAREKQKKALASAREAAKKAKGELKEERRLYRDYRHRHPEDDLTTKWKALSKKPPGPGKDSEMDALVVEFAEKRSGSVTGSITQAQKTSTKSTEDVLNYLEVCSRYSLTPLVPATSAALNNYVKFGWLQRKQMSAGELKKCGDGLPESAKFKYVVVSKKSEK